MVGNLFPAAKPDPKADTFAEKMVTQIIKNLQVNVTNIHIRFEDQFTNPGSVYSVGVTLNKLVFQVGSNAKI